MTAVKSNYNRRSFLKVSAAAGGGMLISFHWLMSCNPKAEVADSLAPPMPDEWFKLNGYIKIGETGLVTIYSPNPEIGQNVMTSMPMIVAEELDVNWDHVVVEQGELNEEVFELRQFAGGSLSIMLGWETLRKAGATARHMLLAAAAKEWGVPVSSLSVKEGIVKENNGERSLSYGELASKAVEMEMPEDVALKDPKDFSLIGTFQPNVEGPKLVTGQPLFGIDFKREGMKLAMIVQPPAFGKTPDGFNKDEILAMDGITDAFIIDTKVEGARFSENAFQRLIALVGDSTWQLINAKKAVKATWKTIGELENSDLHEKRLEEYVVEGEAQESRVDGDPENALKKADKVIERTFTAPFQAHNCMEPMNFFAHVAPGKTELIGPCQTPAYIKDSVSKLLGIPMEEIYVKTTRMGGGFGRRLYTNYGLEAAAISKQAGGIPIKMIYTREDDMTNGIYRPAYRSTYKAGLDKDNNLVAFVARGAGYREGPTWPERFPAGAVKNYATYKIMTPSNISTGAWRAPRSHFTAGAEQAFLDEIAELAGKDPIDFRLELLQGAKQNPVGEKFDYDPDRYAGVLKLVREKCGWGNETPGIYRGVSAYFCHNSYVAEVVDLEMVNGEPKVKKVWCAVDCGIVVNKEGAINMIQGGVVDGIGHAMYSELTFKEGSPQQQNFDRYQLIRNRQAPDEVEVFFVENGLPPTGLGEPGLPPAVAALANALYKATGRRYYRQPFISDKPELVG